MKKIAIALTLLFIFVEVATIKDYGMNWDEPARLLRGQAFLQFFLTGSPIAHLPDRTPPSLILPKQYITRYDFLAEEGPNKAKLPPNPRPQKEFADMLLGLRRRVSYYQDDRWSAYFMTYTPFEAGHLPLPELLASVMNRWLYQAWNVMPDIDSYHVAYVLLSSVGIFVTAMFTFDITGSWVAGLISGVGLALFPIMFGGAHFNVKDPEIAAFFAACVWTFWHWVRENKTQWMVWFFIFLGISLCIKWNTVFLPFIFSPWLWTIRKTPEFRRWWKPQKLIPAFMIGGLSCIALMILIWPVSWGQPFRALWDVVKFYWGIGVGDSSVLQPDGFVFFGFNTYPTILILTQTPEIILLFAGAALWDMVVNQDRRAVNIRWLIFLWIVVPIARYSMPHAHAYGDWRQIKEVAPALVVLAGFGVAYILRITRGAVQKGVFICIAILFALLLYNLISIHPNENLYFNILAGGTRGAHEKNLIDYYATYGNIYKQGALWLDAHAEPNAHVAILNGLTFALSPLWLRPDIAISPDFFSAYDRKGEYIFALPSPVAKPFFPYGYVRSFLIPIHTIDVNGVPILAIYKNDPAHVAPGYARQKKITTFTDEYVISQKGDYLSVDLGANERITALTITNFSSKCAKENYYTGLHEFIRLTAEIPGPNDANEDHTYGIMEKKLNADGSLSYYLPGDAAEYIRVYPQTTDSCFNGAKLQSVSVLAQ